MDKLDSNSSTFYFNQGNTFKEQGNLPAAMESYRKALRIRPDYSDAHNGVGAILQAQGKLDEAVESYRKAQFIEPTGILAVLVELTSKCNFHCDFCPSDSLRRPVGFMSLELAKKIYDEVAEKKLVPYINLHLMGEPTLHPELPEILTYGSSVNLKTSLVTNGSTLNERSISFFLENLYGELNVSLQTPTRETYKHRGKTGLGWERYIGNIRLLVREYLKRIARKQATKNTLCLRVMYTTNSNLLAKIVQTADDANAILREWSKFVSGVEQELGLSPFPREKEVNQNEMSYLLQQGLKITFWQGESFANSRLSNEFSLEPLKSSKFCTHPFTDVGILWNGDVTLCCFDYDGQLVVGNVRDGSIESVLGGEKAQNLRAAMLSCRPFPPFCQQCQAKVIASNIS